MQSFDTGSPNMAEVSQSGNAIKQGDGDPQNITQALCDDCNSIDFDYWFNEGIEKDTTYIIKPLDISDIKTRYETCQFCRFLFDLWSNSDDPIKTPDNTKYALALMSTSNYQRYVSHPAEAHVSALFILIDLSVTESETQSDTESETRSETESETRSGTESKARIVDAVKLWIDSAYYGLILSSDVCNADTKSIQAFHIDPNSVDFDRVASWLEDCERHHGATCQHEQPAFLPHFKLLDCEARKLVSRDLNEKYAALSYVWGPDHCSNNQGSGYGGLSEQTIEDAMVVTRRLRLRYLWVDRYCIPQDDTQNSKEVKHIQLSRMDQIYLSAEVTIVAAYGNSANSGLCGVSVPRTFQPTVQIKGRTLISTFQSPSTYIRNSERCGWNKRGWTYQEGALSRRCLYFTKEQVYFECRGSSFQESIIDDQAVISLHDDLRSYDSEFRYRVQPPNFFDFLNNHPSCFYDRIREYTERSLTNHDDALDAFRGILNRFKHPQLDVSSIFGVPVLSFSGQSTFQEGFAAGLCWGTTAATWLVSLRVTSEEASPFPTWSWIAWDCRILPTPYATRGLDCPRKLNFEFELTSRTKVSWQQLRDDFDEKLLSRFMHVESWVLPIDLVWLRVGPEIIEAHAILNNGERTIFAQARVVEREAEKGNTFIEGELDSEECLPFGDFKDVDALQKVRCEILLLGHKSEVICNTDDSWVIIRDESRGPLKAPFCMIIKNRGDYFERIGHIPIFHDVKDWDGENLDLFTDISWAFANAEWKSIRLG